MQHQHSTGKKRKENISYAFRKIEGLAGADYDLPLQPKVCEHLVLPSAMMLRCVVAKNVKLVGVVEMRKTDCFGEMTYLAHHELESE